MKTRRLAAAAALVLLAGCLLGAAYASSVTADGDDSLPSGSATDWVTYADHLVRIRVDGERRVAPTQEEVAAGEGVIGRQVMITREDVYWTRPGFTEPAPRSMTWDAGGWVFHGRDEKRLHFDGVAELVPGHRYLVPIVHMALSADGQGTPVWLPLSGTAMLPFDGGRVGRGERIGAGLGSSYVGHSFGRTPLRDSVWGKGVRDVVTILDATAPDPAAAAYLDEVPRVRYERAVLATGPPPEPGPGEIP